MRDILGMRLVIAAFAAGSVMACATTSTSSTTWTAGDSWSRTGRVESIQEIVQRVQGDPTAGAIAGALIGGLLFRGDGPATLFGAATGAAVGAAASQGSAETRSYHVLVRFDDGARGVFVFGGVSPFHPGEIVVLTPRGLMRG